MATAEELQETLRLRNEKRLGVPDWPGRPGLQPRVLLLYRRHGFTPGKRCKTCGQFYTRQLGGRYFKCLRSPVSGGPATDWRANWPACGLWEPKERTDGEP